MSATVLLLDPRWPTLIPLHLAGRIGGTVEFTPEVPVAVRWGRRGARVNAISPGPMKTLAGAAIGGARKTFRHTEANAPLRANATLEAIGGTAVWLASDWGACTTGEVVTVDGGYHVLGMPQSENI